MSDDLRSFAFLAEVLNESELVLARKPWARVQATLNEWRVDKLRLWLAQNAPQLPSAQHDSKAEVLRKFQLIFLAGKRNFADQGTSANPPPIVEEAVEDLRISATPTRKRLRRKGVSVPMNKGRMLQRGVRQQMTARENISRSDSEDDAHSAPEMNLPPSTSPPRSLPFARAQQARRFVPPLPTRVSLSQEPLPSLEPSIPRPNEGDFASIAHERLGLMGSDSMHRDLPSATLDSESAFSASHLFTWLASSDMLADELLEWRVMHWARLHAQPDLIALIQETRAMMACLKRMPTEAARRVVVGFMSDDQQPQSAFNKFFKHWSKEDKSRIPRRTAGFQIRPPQAAAAKAPPICYACQRPGHVQRDCPDRAVVAPRAQQ